jgi:AhpD family alkylhydroperoxidase
MSQPHFTDPTEFTDYTEESAPEASQRPLQQTRARLGYLPAAMARMAESPDLTAGFLAASAQFERTSLEPLAREVVVLTIAVRLECHVCIAMHSARLTALAADQGLISALRAGQPVTDPRLEALREFTLAMLASAGAVSAEQLRSFLGRGYTRQNALEVALGIGAYTMSILANRMTGAPVDQALAQFA